ncbi:14297_t:CDS:2 [Cetraspora pellucida]|uniref:14297_t:CDS:1 n=1 Tax=Cetraspora pellucida TaxID=1433469 RepID=A0ACA9NVJ6_9GLOM|nr:14297_t:CDS:2 [Cetraspora pellucida]
MWPAITTLTRNCTPLSISISNEELDLTNMLTIFDEKEENIVDVDEELEIIIMTNGGKFNLSQPQNTDNLVEKAIDLLREKYDLLSIRNESITNLVNVEKNDNQMSLFLIMFGLDITSISDKNEVDEYFKVDQMPITTNLLNW